MNSLYNLARVTTNTVGTGTITLGAAVPGWLTLAQAGVPDGAVITIAIHDVNGGKEIRQSTYTATGTTLTRAGAPYRSTGAGNNTNISLSGSAEVFISAAAEDIGSALVNGTISGTTTLPATGQIASGGSISIGGNSATNASQLDIFVNSSVAYSGSNIVQGRGNQVINTNTTNNNSLKYIYTMTNDAAAQVTMGGFGMVFPAHAAGSETAAFVWQQRIGGVNAETMRLTTNGLLAFGGGETGSFPALKRNSNILEARLADDSGQGYLAANWLALGTTSFTTDLAYLPKLVLSGTGPGIFMSETDTGQAWSLSALGGAFYLRDGTLPQPVMAINTTPLFVLGAGAAFTASFPALKRSSTTLQVRLADDSGYGTLDVLSILDSGVASTGTAGSGYVRASSPLLSGPNTDLVQTTDEILAAGTGLIVPDYYEIAAGVSLEIGADAVLEIT